MPLLLRFVSICAVLASAAFSIQAQPAIAIGSRLELFVDRLLVDKFENTQFKLHEPALAGVALRFDYPWEGTFTGYVTVIQDGGLFRMYYRGVPGLGSGPDGAEVTCYAESTNGITWTKPNLGLFEVRGSRRNNVILAGQRPFSSNFAPFLDTRPGVPTTERFKALAGTEKSGLVAFVSSDGLHWNKLREEAVITKGVFDSQNVAFWSESEHCYVAYFRTWTDGLYRGFRTISRASSTNFLNWTTTTQMDFGDTPMEHLYTSQTQPYFRAPHIYIALPMRFVPGRKAVSEQDARELGIVKSHAVDCTDVTFMSSRGGTHFTRLFLEGFIRPGPDLGNWVSRSGLSALGVVPTGPNEISIYKQAHYAQPSNHLLRYTLRTDGFISVNAPYAGGEFLTKPITFEGRELVINFSASAAGSVRLEIQDPSGAPVPGYTLAEAREEIGDQVERVMHWKGGSDVSALAGKPIRLRFVMKDADLYSLRFRP